MIEAVAAVRGSVPSARIAMLCDDTTANDLDGIVPTYLSEGVATAALRF